LVFHGGSPASRPPPHAPSPPRRSQGRPICTLDHENHSNAARGPPLAPQRPAESRGPAASRSLVSTASDTILKRPQPTISPGGHHTIHPFFESGCLANHVRSRWTSRATSHHPPQLSPRASRSATKAPPVAHSAPGRSRNGGPGPAQPKPAARRPDRLTSGQARRMGGGWLFENRN